MHKIYASGTILYRGSTLLAVLIVQPLILMITESPDRIGVTQSWSSHYTPSEYSHQMYSSLLLPVMLLVSSLFCPFDKSYCILFFLLCKEFFCEIFSKYFPNVFQNILFLSSAAEFIFLSTSTRTRIISSNFLSNYNSAGFLLL